MSIMSLLPQENNESQLHSFQTESEPLGEGVIGIVNSKVGNHKGNKPSGFIKKNDRSVEDSLHSTYKS